MDYDRQREAAAQATQAALPLLGQTGTDFGGARRLLSAALASITAIEAHREAVAAAEDASEALSRAQGACLDALGKQR